MTLKIKLLTGENFLCGDFLSGFYCIIANFVNSTTTCICAIPDDVPEGLKHARILKGCH
jgi:hypothetical protein